MVKEKAVAADRFTVAVFVKPPGPVMVYVTLLIVTPPPRVAGAARRWSR